MSKTTPEQNKAIVLKAFDTLGIQILAGLSPSRTAIVGVYGVLSYVVSRRTAEIGVRMAMGAGRGDILKIVYNQGMWIVGVGRALGLAGAFAVAHLLGSLIVVSATDPTTYVSVSAVLAAIAMLACYIPARRAMHVEHMQALRSE